MAVKNEPGIVSADGKFVITRVFDAPPELIFRAWTKPEHMVNWWGPHHFTNPVCELDVRVGGSWRIVMRGPDGVEHPAKGVYREIVPGKRIVMTIDHSGLPDEWHDLLNPHRDKSKGKPSMEVLATVTFEPVDGKTRQTIRLAFESAAVREAFLKIGMNEGWSQSLERLATELSNTAPASLVGDREIAIERVFAAPRELVFKVWTDPHHIGQWWGPKGFTTTTHIMEVKPGGVWNFIMHGPDGRDYHNRITFLEVVEPRLLVFKHNGDKDTEPVSHQTTVTFDDAGGKTRLNMRMVFQSAAARDEIEKKYGAVNGLTQTIGRLGEYVIKQQNK